MTLVPGQVLNNRYRIAKLLSQGGFGSVYRAWDLNLGTSCAVKENLETSAAAQAQFQREATILANLRHPNLPNVRDHFFIQNQGQYLVMDFVEGQDLQEKLDQLNGPLPESQVLTWMDQILEALDYLHHQNPPVIHRDIKPGNIRITPQGIAMLVDFGIAKVYDPAYRTTLGARAVTPGFAPFEQYGQRPTDARTDLYALGATMYTLLTGQVPPESIDRVAGTALPPPRSLNPTISPGTELTILKAMEIMPEQRYPSAQVLRKDLQRPARVLPVALTAQASTSISPSTIPPHQPFSPPAIHAARGTSKSSSWWMWVILAGGVLAIGLFLVLRKPQGAIPTAIPPAPEENQLATQEAAVLMTETAQASGELPAEDTPTLTQELPVVPPVGPSPTWTELVQPSDTPTPVTPTDITPLTDTPTPVTPTNTPLPPEDPNQRINSQDGATYVRIPAGNFWRGVDESMITAMLEQCSRCERRNFEDALPLKQINLPEFWMYKTEVTTEQYQKCVQDGVCSNPQNFGSRARNSYYGDYNYANYPVVYITWADAANYCQWAGGRLPTEAEWEKAARGTDMRLFPWGSQSSGASKANTSAKVGDTTAVGSYPQGQSPYGLMDMAGNVYEWTLDWYNASYYIEAPDNNPGGPESGDSRVIRGGSADYRESFASTVFRDNHPPFEATDQIGFRCVIQP